MWFKQIQVFQLTDSIAYSPDKIAEQLEPLAFTSCLPSMHSSAGWIAPVDVENAPLVHGMNGNIMLCLQIEEKILPATVVRQELNERRLSPSAKTPLMLLIKEEESKLLHR